MAIDLSKLPLEDLLGKFASGGHKPGSGSAAALQGLVSCALAKTVVELTRNRSKYRQVHAKLDSIKDKIANEIEPVLWQAFAADSKQFGKVIDARNARDREQEPFERWKLARRALKELYEANEIPLLIAEKCLLLAQHAATIFDIGFEAARGDSEVAIDAALSAVTGSVSIVYLNLSSFSGDAKAVDHLNRAVAIEEQANILKLELQGKINGLKSDAKAANNRFTLNLKTVRDPRATGLKYSDTDIEQIARNVQNEIWNNRRDIWDQELENETQILSPGEVFGTLGYTFETRTSLGQIVDAGEIVEVAGYINKADRFAAVSGKFPLTVQRFTAAHELGHAVLHKRNEQFRDRALDGAIVQRRSQLEYEADKFATYFLMPENFVRKIFRGLFGMEKFVVTDATAFAIGAKNAVQLINECPTLRELSLRLANAKVFSHRAINPISTIFGVSGGAMAIRIEELRLVDSNGYRLRL